MFANDKLLLATFVNNPKICRSGVGNNRELLKHTHIADVRRPSDASCLVFWCADCDLAVVLRIAVIVGGLAIDAVALSVGAMLRFFDAVENAKF